MFQIDDQFLIDVGLGAMPESDRPAFLQHVYETLELRVGTHLSDGLSDDQLEEFQHIIDHNADVIVAWIEQHSPDFLNDPVYLRMREVLSDKADAATIVSEYAATKWLEVNRSDYRDVVARALDTLKAELSAQSPQILAPYADRPLTGTGGA